MDTSGWELGYAHFLEWPVDERGRRLVPQRYRTPDGFALGAWQDFQRQEHRKGTMNEARHSRLEAAGIVWDSKKAAWGDGLEHFEAIPRDETGKRMVSQTFVTADGYRLGLWQHTQRQMYKQGNMVAARVARLEAAGIVWDVQEFHWERTLHRFVQEPADAEGKRRLPADYVTADGFRLGAWVLAQRFAYRKGVMNAMRIERLEAAGMLWDIHPSRDGSAWEAALAIFQAYPADADGNRRVPALHVDEGGFALGAWQHAQRLAWKAGGLSAEHISKLEAAGIVWEPMEAAWEEGFSHFEAVSPDASGQRLVRSHERSEDGFQLGVWLNNQRRAHKHGKLSAARVARLERAGIIWSQQAAMWAIGFAHFEAYPRDARGLRRPPSTFVTSDGFRLGAWQTTQRTALARQRLSEARRERLEAAGIVWDEWQARSGDPPSTPRRRRRPRQEDQLFDSSSVLPGESWELRYNQFLAWRPNREGKRLLPTTFVAPDGFKLGRWLENQRRARRRGELSKARIIWLEVAGVVWEPKLSSWEESLTALLAFPVNADGFRSVPRKFVTADGLKLGNWVASQRSAYKKGTLSKLRAERLQAAGIVWELVPGATASKSRARGSGAPGLASGVNGASCAERRRRLELVLAPEPTRPEGELRPDLRGEAAGGLLTAAWDEEEGGLLTAAPADEAAWHEKWRQRLGCWWLALPGPSQTELGHCLGALSLHLGSRLERLLGRPPPSASGAAAATEPGCGWLEAASDELELPDFPSLGDGFDFSLPPLPRLLPPWGQMQLRSHAPREHHASEPQVEGLVLARAALGTGVGAAFFLLTAGVLSRVARVRRARQPTVVTACHRMNDH